MESIKIYTCEKNFSTINFDTLQSIEKNFGCEFLHFMTKYSIITYQISTSKPLRYHQHGPVCINMDCHVP